MRKARNPRPKTGKSSRAVHAVRHEETYRLLVNEVRDYAIFMIDPQGFVLTWNAGAERLKGYTAQEVIGSHFSRFFSEEEIKAGKPQRELETALADGRVENEGWRVRKDGTMFWANVIMTALYDATGTLRGFAKITRDLTERRKAEDGLRQQAVNLERQFRERTDELAQANKSLAEANRAKDDFLATLSHELRTPMTSAYGWLQLLMSGNIDERTAKKGFKVIDRNLRAQIRLIDDLLNVSHIVAGKFQLDLKMVDVRSIAGAAVDAIRPSATMKGVHVELTISSDVDMRTAADPTRLGQVFGNLLSNALKFTPSGGRVDITLERTPDSLRFKVSDTGEGIETDFLPHVFERFRQADSSQARRHGGLGIGLAVVRQVVELHGGLIEVESGGKGKGATFTVVLPIRESIETVLPYSA